MNAKFESVFAQASFQFCGHIDEYLIRNTRHLCLMYCQPRFGEHNHVLRRYEEGKLIEERKITSSQNCFAYYWLWFWHHNVELWRFARTQSGKTLVVVGHPIGCFGMTISKLFCNLCYSYQIGDYFPSRSFVIRAYECVKKFYNNHVDFAYYLSDQINRKLNGYVRDDASHKTVMWGLKPFTDCVISRDNSKRILFVGLLRSGQGIDKLLGFLAKHEEYTLSLVGVAANGYEQDLNLMLDDLKLHNRVYFANRFHSENELRTIAKSCFCGIAIYDLSADNFTHYADPGKVKAYVELGLPVVMTRISDVVKYIERFNAGRVIDSIDELGSALIDIANNSADYACGVSKFCDYFDYDIYYHRMYNSWEDVWK